MSLSESIDILTGNAVSDSQQSYNTHVAMDSCFAESTMVTIHIDDNHRTFTIHKDILCSRSDFFTACFRLGMKEASSNTIKLEARHGYNADAFAIVSQWLYKGKSILDSFININDPGHNDRRTAQERLTKIYIQADRLIMPALKNDIIDTITSFSELTLPSLKSMKLLRDAIPLETKLEKFFLANLVYWLYTCPDFLHYNANGWHLEAKEYLAMDGELSYKALKEVARIKARGERDLVSPTDDHGCRFHEHGKMAPRDECPAQMFDYVEA